MTVSVWSSSSASHSHAKDIVAKRVAIPLGQMPAGERKCF